MNAPSFPITVTPEALARIRHLMSRDGRDNARLRVGIKGGGCSGLEYAIQIDDSVRDGDLTLDIEGVTLVCDPKSAAFLQGATLHYTGNLIGGGFTFDNPNAARSCGCGTSFTPKSR